MENLDLVPNMCQWFSKNRDEIR